MKVVIPVDENGKTVCVAFARAPYFLVCDTQADQGELMENPAASAQGGAGIKAAQFVLDTGAEALITVRLGENSAQVLQEAAVRIYRSMDGDAEKNLDALKKGALSELTEFHAGFHGRA